MSRGSLEAPLLIGQVKVKSFFQEVYHKLKIVSCLWMDIGQPPSGKFPLVFNFLTFPLYINSIVIFAYSSNPQILLGPAPDCRTEICCYRIPRDCFEDELVLVFQSMGKLYELRLMIKFSGVNWSYCYVKFCNSEDAK